MDFNKKYKASVFSFLFSDPDVLRELYCALEGVTLPPDIPVTINTLQDVLFMDRINDISFEIGGKLVVLIEHQSTINPNMALRLLMYIGRVYEKIVENRNIYSTRQIALPIPEFFVLYNGDAPYPDEAVLKLSDAFESVETLGLPDSYPNLELAVRVININHGRNAGIAERCKTLAMYSAFVGKVRDYEKGGVSKDDAVKKAVVYCRDHDILKEFLERNATEVLGMLMTEWNWDDALAVRYEDGFEDGKEEGIDQGREEGREQGIENVARNAMAEGASMDFIQKITGLSMDAIRKLGEEKI